MAKIILIAKYTFFVVVVFSAGLAIERLQGIKRWWVADSYKADDLVYNVSSPLATENLDSVLSKQYLKCVTQPAKPFCLLSASRRLEIFRSEEASSPEANEIERRLKNISSDLEPRRRRIHSLLIVFTTLMKSNRVRTVLVEPSMLFCLLSSSRKNYMLSRGFNPGRLLGSRDVVTVGVLDEDAEKLETGNFTKEALSAGFKIKKFRKWIGKENGTAMETAHYFFILQGVAVHVVVFYRQDSYVWHSGLDPKEINFDGLLFVNEGIFENFTISPLDLSKTSISQMFLPHDVQYFMEEIESSRAVQCNSNSSDTAPATHPSLTNEQLQKRVVVALMELKALLSPQVAAILLWSKTLLGWFEKCDIFHHSTALDLALKFRNPEGLNFTALLEENEFLTLLDRSEEETGFHLECHGLHVNIFILHEDGDVLWYKNVKEQKKLSYPIFPVCSSQVFGQKVHVPCTTDIILKLDYGQNKINHTSDVITPSADSYIPSNETYR